MKAARLLIIALAGAAAAPAGLAAAPDGYYKSCENLGAQDLLRELCTVVGPHTNVGYDGLKDVYRTSDVRPDGTIWDMYSTTRWTTSDLNFCSGKLVGDCLNREHSLPKSWWGGGKQTQYSDAFHLYPTDSKVNGQRSNYPFGECAGGSQLAANGSARPLGRLGTSTYPGYSGTVFEPDDEYKGDFARTYFYLAAAYNGDISGWTSGNGDQMLAGNSYPVFKSWAIDMLLKWHREDPVSPKERDRNDAVYAHQHNRNPFIDYPDMAEYIWGDRKGQKWMPDDATPTLSSPVSGSTVNVGSTLVGVARTAEITVSGQALTADVTLSVSGSGFSISPASITKAAACATAGAKATVTFKPSAAGAASGTLTLRSGTLTSTVTLRGAGSSTIPAGPVTAVGPESFSAVWSYIGDARPGGKYLLDVRLGGASLTGYPREVDAAAEHYTVAGLEPLTAYTYTVSSASHVSDAVGVTTAAPIPSVDFLYDEELQFYAIAGEPSDAAEIMMESAYIDTDITITVAAPFELSTDRSTWSRTLVLDPDEDRFYLRVNSAVAGHFFTSLETRAGDYYNDDVDFNAFVNAPGGNFHEDFEAEAGQPQQTYNRHSYEGTMCRWDMDDAGIWSDQSHDKSQCVRMGKKATSTLTMAENHPSGMGTVTLWAQSWDSGEGATFTLEYSLNGGDWRDAGTAETRATWTQHTFTVNAAGPVRLRLRQTAGGRWNIDDIEASAYGSGVADAAVEDFRTWDAYARGGELVVTAIRPAVARVYALDGTEVFHGRVVSEKYLRLPVGLYIVAVDDFARRVLVK